MNRFFANLHEISETSRKLIILLSLRLIDPNIMLEQELELEKGLFYALNGSDSAFLDVFLAIYSDKWIWLPLYAFFLFIFVFKKNWKEILLVLLSIALVITLCDQIASGFFKPFFQRFRPSVHPDFMDQVDLVSFLKRKGGYGFISSHAANAFGFATFTALLFRNKIFTIVFLVHALLTSYSRVYLGVHFVSDVVVGALVGVLSAFIVYKLYIFARKKVMKYDPVKLKKPLYSFREIYSLCGFYILFLIFALSFSNLIVKFLHL